MSTFRMKLFIEKPSEICLGMISLASDSGRFQATHIYVYYHDLEA
jgi:hypothetical protein